MNDSDTEFHVEEEPYNVSVSTRKQIEQNLLIPEAKIQVLSNANEGISTSKSANGKKRLKQCLKLFAGQI